MLKDELDPRLERKFQVLAKTADRDAQAAAAGRARFLDQAREMKAQVSAVAPVSQSPKVRHIGWNIFIPRKDCTVNVAYFCSSSQFLGFN